MREGVSFLQSRIWRRIVPAVAGALLLGTGAGGTADSRIPTTVPGRYIVAFHADPTFAPPLDRPSRLRSMQDETRAALKDVFPRQTRRAAPNLLWAVNAVALTLSKAELEGLRGNPKVETVIPVERRQWLEPEIEMASDTKTVWGIPRTRAPELWKNAGIDGSGVVVGHLDSGLFAAHPALQGQVLAFRDFVATSSTSTPFDDNGHGTHTAGTIVGKADGIGMAPGAMLLVARILDAGGGGTNEGIFAAMQWMLDPDGNPDTDDAPRVVSNSWGSSSTTDRLFWKMVQTWVVNGIVPVFAAGNNGYANGRVGVPAAFPHALAVGATDRSEAWAFFSSLGPATWDGKTYMKPDIAAPGAQILSACKDGGLVLNSGTSMACPHASGLVALLIQANPALTVSQVMDICRDTAVDLGPKGPDIKFGFGRIDAVNAVQKALAMASPTLRLQRMMDRLATWAPDRGDPGQAAVIERALQGMLPSMLSLSRPEWDRLASAWQRDPHPLKRRAFTYFQAVRRFRILHGELETGP